MKKIILALMAIVALGACSGEQKQFAYRGLPLDLPVKAFVDSLTARGFAVDSAKSDSAFNTIVMGNPAEKYRLVLAQRDGKLVALQENYKLSTNDSTSMMWQQLRDGLEKELDEVTDSTTYTAKAEEIIRADARLQKLIQRIMIGELTKDDQHIESMNIIKEEQP